MKCIGVSLLLIMHGNGIGESCCLIGMLKIYFLSTVCNFSFVRKYYVYYVRQPVVSTVL